MACPAILNLVDYDGGDADCGCNDCLNDCCNDCCGCGGLYAEAELLYFKYLRADGNRVSIDDDGPNGSDDVDFDFHTAPRLTLGWISCSGLGIRARYFEYDESHGSLATGGSGVNLDRLTIDTYTIDVEVFERTCLNECWDIELSAGVRYNEFFKGMADAANVTVNTASQRVVDFQGWGLVAGLQANRSVGCYGSLYVRVRGSLLSDDKFLQNEEPLASHQFNLRDSIQGVTELAVGYEITKDMCYGLMRMRAGYEYQLWHNYSGGFANTGLSGIQVIREEAFFGPADVGFGGFTFMVGLER